LLKTGNIEELSRSFASTVDMSIMGSDNTYPDTEAKTVLTNFFNKIQPQTAKVLHRITSNSNYRFGVVILTGNNGAYRVSFSLKNNNSKFELTEIRIETEKTK